MSQQAELDSFLNGTLIESRLWPRTVLIFILIEPVEVITNDGKVIVVSGFTLATCRDVNKGPSFYCWEFSILVWTLFRVC